MSKHITIYDIAEASQVSASTVSRALRKEPSIGRETRKRILAKAEELGYRFNPFASNLRTNRTRNIGVITPKLDDYYFSGVLGGIERELSNGGYNTILHQSLGCAHREKAAISTLHRSRVDGMIMLGPVVAQENEYTQAFSNGEVPVVVVDSSAWWGARNISVDNYTASYELTTHLIQVGCREIAHVTTGTTVTSFNERLNGYKAALQYSSLPVVENLVIIDDKCETSPDYLDRLFSRERLPDAIFFASDVAAVTAIPFLRSNGVRIPEDIRIAGFGNDPLGRIIEPTLTTIDFAPVDVGRSSARHILSLIGDLHSKFEPQPVKHQLIIRHSSTTK
jgi:LacI family transcriptional regulator